MQYAEDTLALLSEFESKYRLTLRDYQKEAVQSVFSELDTGKREPNFLIHLPTGLGKTLVATVTWYVLQERYKEYNRTHPNTQKKMLWIVDRTDLLKQTRQSFKKFSPKMTENLKDNGIYEDAESNTIFVTRQKLMAIPPYPYSKDDLLEDKQDYARTEREKNLTNILLEYNISMYVVDESHHALSRTYQHVLAVLRRLNGDALHLGITATPYRGDGRNLEDFYTLVYSLPLEQAMRDNWIPPIHISTIETHTSLENVPIAQTGDFESRALSKAINTDGRNGLIINEYKKFRYEHQNLSAHTIAFCADKQHAEDLATSFKRANISSAYLHSGLKKSEREEIIEAFKRGEIDVLTNVDIATEGFDDPEINCVLFCSETCSLTRQTQRTGRATRVSKDVAPTIGSLSSSEERKESIAHSGKPGVYALYFHDEANILEKHQPCSPQEVFDLPRLYNPHGMSVLEALDIARREHYLTRKIEEREEYEQTLKDEKRRLDKIDADDKIKKDKKKQHELLLEEKTERLFQKIDPSISPSGVKAVHGNIPYDQYGRPLSKEIIINEEDFQKNNSKKPPWLTHTYTPSSENSWILLEDKQTFRLLAYNTNQEQSFTYFEVSKKVSGDYDIYQISDKEQNNKIFVQSATTLIDALQIADSAIDSYTQGQKDHSRLSPSLDATWRNKSAHINHILLCSKFSKETQGYTPVNIGEAFDIFSYLSTQTRFTKEKNEFVDRLRKKGVDEGFSPGLLPVQERSGGKGINTLQFMKDVAVELYGEKDFSLSLFPEQKEYDTLQRLAIQRGHNYEREAASLNI